MKKYIITISVLFIGLVLSFCQSVPFPQNIDYQYGNQPTGFQDSGSASLNWADAKAIYIKWTKLHYVEIPGTKRSRIKWDGGGWTGSSESDQMYTISEAIGYGMLLTVYHGDKEKFDRLLNFYNYTIDLKAKSEGIKRSEILMPWIVDEQGVPYEPMGGNDPAIDGDMDVAMSLIVANQQWPENGYLIRSKEVIHTMKTKFYQVCEDGYYIMMPGNFGGCNDYKENANDVSYYCPGYFKLFAQVMADTTWNIIARDSYHHLWQSSDFYKNSNEYDFSKVKLAPDFQKRDGSAHDFRNNRYAYDASRIPWRLTINYIWNGDKDSGYDWVLQATSWVYDQGVDNVRNGYNIDGSDPGDGKSAAFTGGFTIGSMILTEKEVTEFSSELKKMAFSGEYDSYFDLTLTAIYSLTLTGNFWEPME